jgi:hypothetical protein
MNKIKDFIVDFYYEHLYCHWFDYYFYEYLFRKADNPGWCSDNNIIDFFRRLKCRYKNHPCGSIYYNPGGYEPDGRCQNCGDLIE